MAAPPTHTVVLKHLARTYDMDPHRLRQLLRDNGLTPTNKRWKWTPGSKEYRQVIRLIGSLKNTSSSVG